VKNRSIFSAFLALLVVLGASAELIADDAIDPKTEQLLEQALGGESVSAYWLPDSTTPARATEAIGVLYRAIEGAAGNVTIEMGHFSRSGADYRLTGRVREVYGMEPRDVGFLPDRIELTTTMPKPGDPRCCPTGSARWSIDRASLEGKRLP
jgi:hypothetical protein